MIVTAQLPRLKKIAWLTLSLLTCAVLIFCVIALWGDREALLWIAVSTLGLTSLLLGAEFRRVHKAKRMADRANMAKSRFLANISQEIRTPMEGIVGMTDLLLLSGLTADQEHFAQTVKSSAGSLLKLLNQMLDFSRIIDGQVQSSDCDFELHEVIDNAVVRYIAAAAEKGLNLHCHIAPNLPEVVRGDPLRLQQVLNELVGNAVKFTAAGEVRVFARCLGHTEYGHILQIEVHDTGPGITRETRARIFDSYAGVRSYSKQPNASGMGLAIAKQIVTSAHGNLDFDTEAGYGSKFWIVMPVGRSSLDLPRLNRALLLSDARVRIACRSESLHHLVEDYCRSFGMTVCGAAGEADVLITDSQRANKLDCPVLLITHTGEQPVPSETALQLPVRRRELEAAVMSLVRSRAASAPELLPTNR